jgi:UDP-glucose:(heptosyl)LPS alpha-1,3-glucosyltransferase
MIRAASWLKVLSFALFSRRLVLRERGRFDVIIAFDRTLVMDIYRAGNACHKEWQAFRRRHGGLKGRISMVLNPLHLVINRIEGRIFSRLGQTGGTVVVLSEAGMEQIRRHYRVDEDRFVVVPPAVDFGRFKGAGGGGRGTSGGGKEKRGTLGIGDDTLLLLHVGSGFRIKGLKNTIKALAVLKERGVKAVLIVAGSDRSATTTNTALARRLGIEDRVRFLGGVEDIGGLYAAADVFVMPSLFETFGAAAIEALYFGLPVIIGRGAGVSSMIEEEGVGTVVDVPANPAPLAHAIQDTAAREEALRASGKLQEERQHRRKAALRCRADVVMKRFLSVIDKAGYRDGLTEDSVRQVL